MAVKYHVNPETGRANICRAKVLCDFAVDGIEPPHYKTKDEAKKGAEKNFEKEYGGSFAKPESKKSSSKEIDPYGDYYTENLEMNAMQIRAGDVIVGEKFSSKGEWQEDNAVVKNVETGISMDMRSVIFVTYENGKKAEFAGRAPVKVKKPSGYIEGRNQKELSSDVKKVYKKAISNQNNIVERKDADTLINALNDPNADENMAAYGRRVSDIMEDNNQHQDAIKVSAACERIRLSYDSDAKINQHFDLIYDDKTPDILRKRAIAEKPENLEDVKDLYKLHGKEWTFTS